MIGQWEILIILLVVLLLFGGRRIPDIARGIGKGIREFRRALEGKDDEDGQPKTPGDGAHGT